MKVKIINNPTSGTQTLQKNLEIIIGRLVLDKTIKTVDKVDTTINFDYSNEILEMKDKNYDLLMIVGGDGTVNNVINAVAKHNLNVPLLILPAGTVNDLGKFLDLPTTIEGVCSIIKNHEVKEIDLCKVNDKYFINVAAAGLLADIAIKTPVEAKTVLGRFAYYAQGIKEVPKQLFESLKFQFKHDDETLEADALLFLVLNSKSAGGFSSFAPKADISDGVFDVCIIKKSYLLNTAGVFLKIFSGEHIKDPNVIYFQTDNLEVNCLNKENLLIDVDGEFGGTFPAKFEITKKALKVIIKKSSF
ncbi:diacylglycerol/lipid kinase family protein [Tepidibacter formicigenes]|jgi:diacylglycerol kinase (ATP)|uniref:Diacylglycerol kinase (ATP) n=1 Tax=Tepidibacter formicigenes DSM 15518 TaxID=1123349 RepID=A0A1M6NAJ7_9FIRM|nr:YegS/Rv2252/BmrU family lipid kinase [Tepidibacter formicigenes]SHJ92739.1 diacylglycerol kinase (ATP) [Tepidibacter formicigenes DSM 15518]